MIFLSKFALPVALLFLIASRSAAFVVNGHWNATATNPVTGPSGSPITLTWSIAPDGTSIPGENPSNLIAYLDGLFPGGSGSDLQLRPWFTYVAQSFDRWSALSGVTFTYEAVDDAATLGSALGSLNHRGDVRLGGAFLDGVGGTNAQTGFVDNADITVETGDTPYFSNSSSSYRAMRNTLMHEIGHSMGLGHSDSNSAAFLMESFSNNTFDGPQLDDIRGAQQQYGDAFEKSNSGSGNNTAATATDFGSFIPGQAKLIGVHASTGTLVLASETDFVSITNHNDFDYFAFSTTGPTSVDVTLTPVGASYNERFSPGSLYTTTVASAVSNLSLDVYRLDNGVPTLLSTSNSHPAGQAETVQGLALGSAGQYLARVSGSTDVVQFYELGLNVVSLVLPTLEGDYNHDSVVDSGDYLLWRATLGQSGANLAADGDGNLTVDAGDYDVWRSHFGNSSPGLGAAIVPEPTSLGIVFAILSAIPLLNRRFRSSRYDAHSCNFLFNFS